MEGPSDLETFLGRARLATYLQAAHGSREHAKDLYLWVTELAGALHAQLPFVEIAVRNTIDQQLATWNEANGCGRQWTAERLTAPVLYQLLRKPLEEADPGRHAKLRSVTRSMLAMVRA